MNNPLFGQTPIRVSNDPVIDSSGIEQWPADYDPHGRVDLGGGDTRRVHIASEETWANNPNFQISLTIDPKMLYTYNDQSGSWELVSNLNGAGGIMDTPAEITIAFRELEYCDSDGNTKRILVLASEPYDPA